MVAADILPVAASTLWQESRSWGFTSVTCFSSVEVTTFPAKIVPGILWHVISLVRSPCRPRSLLCCRQKQRSLDVLACYGFGEHCRPAASAMCSAIILFPVFVFQAWWGLPGGHWPLFLCKNDIVGISWHVPSILDNMTLGIFHWLLLYGKARPLCCRCSYIMQEWLCEERSNSVGSYMHDCLCKALSVKPHACRHHVMLLLRRVVAWCGAISTTHLHGQTILVVLLCDIVSELSLLV